MVIFLSPETMMETERQTLPYIGPAMEAGISFLHRRRVLLTESDGAAVLLIFLSREITMEMGGPMWPSTDPATAVGTSSPLEGVHRMV
jgi:hypothetical protein